MCESNVYLRKDDREELFMADVELITPKSTGKLLIRNIMGEEREVAAEIKEIDLMGHRILLEAT